MDALVNFNTEKVDHHELTFELIAGGEGTKCSFSESSTAVAVSLLAATISASNLTGVASRSLTQSNSSAAADGSSFSGICVEFC